MFKELYIKQLKYVNDIAKDILFHECNDGIIEYTSDYASVMRSTRYPYIRINVGETYAYINYQKLAVWYNMKELGCISDNYEGLLIELSQKDEEDFINAGFTDDYEAGQEYNYKPAPYCSEIEITENLLLSPSSGLLQVIFDEQVYTMMWLYISDDNTYHFFYEDGKKPEWVNFEHELITTWQPNMLI